MLSFNLTASVNFLQLSKHTKFFLNITIFLEKHEKEVSNIPVDLNYPTPCQMLWKGGCAFVCMSPVQVVFCNEDNT